MDFSELGFYRVAAVQPPVALADPMANARILRAWALRAARSEACVALFPELAITGYTCEDLFHSQALLDGARQALHVLALETAEISPMLLVGAPYRVPDGRLFNGAFVLHRGQVRGVIPKTYRPNAGEFYEQRWFASGGGVSLDLADELLGRFRLSPRQLFGIGRMTAAVEICEDLWAPIPPSCHHALRGANVIFNLSASDELVAKADYRRELVRQQSARLNAGYVYVSCGPREATKDVVYGGHAMAAENGGVLAEGRRFSREGLMLLADLDVDRLLHERARNATFRDSVAPLEGYVLEPLTGRPKLGSLDRAFARMPFVPEDGAAVGERAEEILSIQAAGLARRLDAARSDRAILGISGGMDSTLALLVSVEAMKLLGKDPDKVLAASMPGFGTTEGTRRSAADLAARLRVEFREIPIAASVLQHLHDIGHDPATQDVTYENAQARERAQILFDLANKHQGLVVGTGDMSELALGWCTYNGDHMAGYNVNASVPKTLVQHLVRWYAEHASDAPTREVLEAVLATAISPELLPPGPQGMIRQRTEEIIGPYVLHDFFLYHHLRNGFGPRKAFALALQAFQGEYEPGEVKRWLRVFFERFYRHQFKRTCLPPGPKVGTVSLSPRGDWRMPDEVDPSALLGEIDAL